jgi:tyrosinase
MPSRRKVLQLAAAAGAAAVFTGTFGGLRAAFAANVRTRRTLHGMSLDDPDLSAYRDFVGIMQGKDQSQLVSWLGFSLQHGNQNVGYKYCPHGDWYFLPWHREYVLMYERAVQALTSYKNFAMPYWDWTTDRTIPAAFTDTSYKGKANPLYVSTRTLTDKRYWPLPDWIVGPEILKQIFRETLFQRFGTSRNPKQDSLDMSWVVRGGGAQGTLEGTPHNLVHNYTGGFMPSPGSPRDPIFFMHHGNIDRIWWWWNGGLGNQNTAGMTAQEQTWWLDMFYKDNYITPDGKFYGVKTRDVQSTQALGYTYDKGFPEFSPKKQAIDPERANRLRAFFDGGVSAKSVSEVTTMEDVNTEGATFDKPLLKRARLPKQLRGLVEATSETKRAPEVFAMLRDIQVPDAVSSIRVFVNADNVNGDTSPTDPHFVTEIGFLQHPGGHGGEHADKEPPSTVIDLTPTLTALSSAGLLKDDTITLQIIAVPREGAAAGEKPQVVPAAVEIAVL